MKTFFTPPIIGSIIALLILILLFTKTKKTHHSNWNTLIDNFNFSSKEFYAELKKELYNHGITGMIITSADLPEGNIFSRKRIYLRIFWKDYKYDVCACPFGDGFYISWWLEYRTPILKILIGKIPFIGIWMANKLYRITYYKIDTASMFMAYAQASVLKVIEDITNDKGVRALSEAEKKPVLNDIFKR